MCDIQILFFIFIYRLLTLLVPSIFLVDDKYEEKMKEKEDEWY